MMMSANFNSLFLFFCKMFRDELEREGVPNIERKIRIGFQTWFRKHVSLHPYVSFIFFGTNSDMYVLHLPDLSLQHTHQEEVSDDVFSLACGPDFRVKKYTSCTVNGVRFNTINRDKNKKTHNSGVMTQGTHNGQFIDFFGTLKEIVQLE